MNPIMDAILCGTILVHSHIGFQYGLPKRNGSVTDNCVRSVIIDYIPAKRLPRTRALFKWGLRAGTVLCAIGIYEFETNDVGVTEAIKRIWKA